MGFFFRAKKKIQKPAWIKVELILCCFPTFRFRCCFFRQRRNVIFCRQLSGRKTSPPPIWQQMNVVNFDNICLRGLMGIQPTFSWESTNLLMGIQPTFSWESTNLLMGINQLSHGNQPTFSWESTNFLMGINQPSHGNQPTFSWEWTNFLMGINQPSHGNQPTFSWESTNFLMGISQPSL